MTEQEETPKTPMSTETELRNLKLALDHLAQHWTNKVAPKLEAKDAKRARDTRMHAQTLTNLLDSLAQLYEESIDPDVRACVHEAALHAALSAIQKK